VKANVYLWYNPAVGWDIAKKKINNKSFENSKWLLVNIWTSIFLAPESIVGAGRTKTYFARTAINSQWLCASGVVKTQ